MKKGLALFTLSFLLVILGSCSDPDSLELKNGTSISPAVYTDSQQKQQIKKYPKLYQAVYESENLDQPRTYIIPGLDQTKTLDINQQVSTSTDMDPQGVAVADRYVFISAYSHDHRHFSVIYVMDRQTGGYIKTLVLPGMPHAGGITYDPKSENLWVTSQVELDHSQISAISLKQIESYDFDVSHRPVKYDQNIQFEDFSVTSYITYSDQKLYVGTFKLNREGEVSIYPLDEKGKLKPKRTVVDDNRDYYTMPSEAQGITFYQNDFLISTSFGSSDSEILRYRNSKHLTQDLTNDEYRGKIRMPPYLEQITANDGQLYILFESASTYYDYTSAPRVDRVLVADIKTLLN
ncbi:YncE family protein [Enterococcus sp. AZ072]|uniref:YncE family protein n=1 Tax=unclassified Enterococcus TaxID=2608891 RepID=UPI003D2E42DC